MNEHPSNTSTFQEQMYYKRVLLIEDDNRIANFIQRGLKAEGYAVEVAVTGQEGLLLATEAQFQTIILDLGLPDIDGQKICECLRARDVNTPILMLTAREGINDKVTGLRGGADDYMTKPFVFDELLARIEALMRRGRAAGNAEPKTFHLADLVLDLETHEVKRGGSLIELTPKEFALLEYFLSRQGKVLSRARILEQVWGYNADPQTNVVDVHIGQLRRKIDDGHAIKLLKTVRGFGYKLDES